MTRKPLVLVIEDNDDLREATLIFLSQQGFDVLGLSCAEEVDDTPTTRTPNLYVVDLNLPGEDGLSLAERLRRAYPQAGIVITTARTQLSDRLAGYAMGADVYLPKPVAPLELLATLSALTKKMLHQASDAGLRLDDQKMLLRGPCGTSRLAESEVRLLVALASAKDQTLERWQVALQLNPDNHAISTDNLQNRISQLRKKVQACGVAGECIKAVRGSGYRLCFPLQIHHS
ncbi:MAG: response regulator transcription factor [Hydrogenophaga sp.]|uniref:response regulator transcription factor n=1 Tax=Hydrogenophaga sp. TaxID=1904254 RepID=UPI002ABA54E7|nr:response regulator transcription factor [Hydrogenophaga sp.]MDZ4100994.1 response regulator transcription factor [Hydrogenophaga sp.]MDZ4239515.1 response regulator transcription factor [Hydrogenophaga sp.]